MNLARTSRAFAKQNIGCEGDNRQGAISIREVLFALPQRRDMPCGAAKMSASGPQAGMPTSSSLLEPHSARHGWGSLLQALGRDRVRSCRRAFFRSVASFIFSLKTRISEYSFWISGRVRSASSCWAVSFNIAAICVLWMWCMAIKSAVGKTERHDTANCGAASLEINSQPYCRFFCSASLPSSGRGLPSAHNEFLDRMNRASKLSRPATTRRRD
jgi:hypothetical protein